MTPPQDLRWDKLSGSAQDALLELAELFLDGNQYYVEMKLSEGGCRDFKVGTTPSTLRKLRNGGT